MLMLLLSSIAFSRASAVITLEMPIGARQLGMGESGAALGNDANTLYYNPAGLAFGPLANEWELSRAVPAAINNSKFYTAFAARNRRGFLTRNEVWAGTVNGMLHFDGLVWRDYLVAPLEGNAKLRDVVRTFIGSEKSLDSIAGVVRNYNGAKTVKEEELLVEVKIPFSVMIKDTVNAVLYEMRTEKLWVGTSKGLFRFDGMGFKDFSSEFGTRRITSLANQGATLWIGTDNGLFAYRNGVFEQRGAVLPSQKINAMAWHETRKELYVGIDGAGVARLTPKQNDNEKDIWGIFGLQDGLMDLAPKAIAVDSSGHVWLAHKEGLSHFNLRRWEQIRFENNEVHSITVSEKGAIWIGTNKGAWSYIPEYSTASGRKSEVEFSRSETEEAAKGEWSHYHNGNGLVSNRVWSLLALGNDLWLSSDAGVERYRAAQNQVTFFYEHLLPVLQIPDLYHFFVGITWPLGDWGTWGAFVNFISFGQTTVTSEFNPERTSEFNSSETVVGLSYGTKLNKNWGLGLSFKFFYSALSSGAALHEPDATTASYAVDVGLLGRDLFLKGLRFGMVLANIGPNVYYVDKSNDDPIPLTWRFGLSYDLISLPDHRITLSADYNKTVIYENSKGEAEPFYISAWKAWFYPETGNTFTEGVMNFGTEYVYAGTVALRVGYLHDKTGKRQEFDIGLGVMLSDMLQLDIASIQNVSSLEGVRDGQLRFSGLFRF
jgi:hypothetical protein